MATTQQSIPAKLRHIQTFTSSGTFYPQDGTTKVFVSIHGASGGAGGGHPRYAGARGGSGGTGRICGGFVQVNPRAPHAVTIGAGGTSAVAVSTGGGTGGTTNFDGAISVPGGSGGGASNGDTTGSAGTTAGAATVQDSLTTLSPYASALPRVNTFNSSGSTIAGGTANTPTGGNAGASAIVHIYGF